MIVIKVEMWPGGNESRAKEFARMKIANKVKTTVSSGGELGDYDVELLGGVYGRDDLLSKVWKRGAVAGVNRRTRGAWDLILLALQATVGKRN